MPATDHDWWRNAVTYQIYPRSFADGDGDGFGDFAGIRAHLPYLVDLGVDAVWISPFYPSPQHDAGYDVANYTDVDPLFGTLAEFDAFLAEAHAAGIRVLVDLVPNHCSSDHPWFQAALAAEPGSPERARFLFRRGRGTDGAEPPNNWESVFGGGAWEPVGGGWWYLHLFDVSQPDFDWTNPDVPDLFDDVLRFWLGRGVDGFRVDVAHGLSKAEGLPDNTFVRDVAANAADKGPMWDQDGVHDIYRRWRSVLDEFDGGRILVAEAWVSPEERMARYLRPDEMNQAFNFPYLLAGWSAPKLRTVINESLAAYDSVGATATWVISNHDVVRPVARLGFTPSVWLPGIAAYDPQPDNDLGRTRARALAMLNLALPGAAYIFQGEELGLGEHTTLPDEVRADPAFFRTGGVERGRDGCRVPLPWTSDAPGCGFGPTGKTWLPQPTQFAGLAADVQADDPDSTLNLYHTLLRLRRQHDLGRARITWNESPHDVLDATIGDVRVLVNMGQTDAPLPAGQVLVASEPGVITDGRLPANTAVWLG